MHEELTKELLQEVISLGQKIGRPIDTEKIHYAVLPDGDGAAKIVSLSAYQYPMGMPPARRRGIAQLYDTASFIKYYRMFSDRRSLIFAKPAKLSLLAVLDHHGAGDAEDNRAEFCDFRAHLGLELSEQWKIWTAMDQKAFTQNDFAEFLEDNTSDILDPRAAEMLEIARDLKAKTDVNFSSSTVLQSGQVQLNYTETIVATIAKGEVHIPEVFRIRIPVFYGEEAVVISARLRFRIVNGKLSFFYRMQRPIETLNNAFNKVVEFVQKELSVDILTGTPVDPFLPFNLS